MTSRSRDTPVSTPTVTSNDTPAAGYRIRRYWSDDGSRSSYFARDHVTPAVVPSLPTPARRCVTCIAWPRPWPRGGMAQEGPEQHRTP